MNEVKYKLNREWLNELLKHKIDSNVYFSLSDNDIRILLTYIDILQSKIDKAIEYIENNKHFEWHTIRNEKGKLDTAKISTDWVSGNEILDILKEDK